MEKSPVLTVYQAGQLSSVTVRTQLLAHSALVQDLHQTPQPP